MCRSVLFEAQQTKLGAATLGLAPTPCEVLAFVCFHGLHSKTSTGRKHSQRGSTYLSWASMDMDIYHMHMCMCASLPATKIYEI